MPLYRRGIAPVDITLGDRNVLKVTLGDLVIWDGTTPVDIAAPALGATASMPDPTLSVGVHTVAPSLAGAATVPAPAASVGATAAPVALTAEAAMPAATVSSGVTIEAPSMGATATIPAPSVGETIVAAPPMTATATAPTPGIVAGANLAIEPLEAEATLPLPDIAVGVTVVIPAMTASASIPAPEALTFRSSGMYKNGTQALTTSYAQVNNWTADTAGYPGSTVSSHGVVAQGSKTGATVAASVPYTTSLNCTLTLRLYKNGVQIAQGSATPSAGSGTATVSVTGYTVTSGDIYTVQASASNNFGTIASGTNTWVRIT